MAKQDGGIIVLDDDDDDDELKTGSSWVGRPWKLPSSLNVKPQTFASGSLSQPQKPPSASTVPLQTHPSTSKAHLRSLPCTPSQTPPSTSKSHPTAHLSSSANLPAPQTNGSDVMSVSDKESAQILLKATNEKLFKEFMDFCGNETAEHPEVMSFLLGRYQKTSPAFLASTEFRNVIGRCLTRVQNKKSKVYVYINELCTVLKSNSEKKKVALSSAPAPASKQKQSQQLQSHSPADSSATETTDCLEQEENQEAKVDAGAEAKEDGEHRKASKRQIRYLENLLSVYTTEIRRLQEKELDLTQLDDEDSIYIQENRLKRKMIRIFEKLCDLKSCCSLTGRVIEQRIPYRGTRYPEVNRCIQKFINKPDNFPDYGDILKVIEKANLRHSLDLTKRQMQSMADDAFREVGNRLQERRHLDMVYNFGSHLTDQYKAGTDPALMDPVLARRLRENRSVALSHLDEVVKKYAVMQDEGEEEMDRKRRRGSMPLRRGVKGSPASSSIDQESTEEEDEDEDEDEDESSDTDIEEELQKCEDLSEPEEEALEEEPVPDITESDQRMDNRSEQSQFSSAGEEVEDEDDEDDEDEDEEEEDDVNVKNGKDFREPQGSLITKPGSPIVKGMENHSKSKELNSKEKDFLKIDALGSYVTENTEPMELEVATGEVPKQDVNELGTLVNPHRQSFPDPESKADPMAEESDERQEILQQEEFVLNIEPLYVSETDSPQMPIVALSHSPTQSSVPVKAQPDFHTAAKASNASSEPEKFQISSKESDCASLKHSCNTETISQKAVLLTSLQTQKSRASSPGSKSTASEIMPQASYEPQSMLDPESAKAETSLPLISSELPSLSPHVSGDCSLNSSDSQNASLRTPSPIHLPTSEPSVSCSASQTHSLPKSLEFQDSSLRTSESRGASPQSESEHLKLSGSHAQPPQPSASSSPSPQMALPPFPDASVSQTQSPRSAISLTSSSESSSSSTTPKLPGSPSTSPKPPDSTSVCQGLPESSTSWVTSPRAVSTGPIGVSSPCSPASQTTFPESSRSLCLSQGAGPEPARSLRSAASKLQPVSSVLGKTKFCSRTKSSDASNSLVECGKGIDSLGSHNSSDFSLEVPRDLQLCKDVQPSSVACKDTSAVHKDSMKRSKDAEKTDTPHTEPLLLKGVSRESKCLNETMPLVPKPSDATCVTKLNLKSETPPITPVKRKRTLADTVRTLQSKFDSASQENGRKFNVASINGNPGGSFLQSNHQSKRARKDDSYHNSNVEEVHSINSDSDNDDGNISLDLHVTCVTPDSPGPLVDSTQDSAFLSLVNNSPFSSKQQHKSTKINAATQCDPEEVIVLSDSD